MGTRGYPPEFRRRVLDLIEAGRKTAQVAEDLRISDQTIYSWRRQTGSTVASSPGCPRPSGLSWPRRGSASVNSKAELAVHRRATELRKGGRAQKQFAAIEVMAAEGLPAQLACRVLDVARYRAIFHNRQRRHFALGMLTPVEFEIPYQPITAA